MPSSSSILESLASESLAVSSVLGSLARISASESIEVISPADVQPTPNYSFHNINLSFYRGGNINNKVQATK